MRSRASILHLDLDAFFASVEQRDKPSLRGRPVIVGGVGHRGVVSTASYEARQFGVHSAMPMAEARRRCPQAAFLAGRFEAYRAASRAVMTVLREVSPRVEPLSLDEAFVDLAEARTPVDLSPNGLADLAAAIRSRVGEVTGGLTASIGIGSSKFIAKLATELGKPDGFTLVPPGTEVQLISPMSVRTIPGVGPATADKLRRIGIHTIADLQEVDQAELVRELGRAHGGGLKALAYARDDRTVEPEREAKSISVEDTFETDLTDPDELRSIVDTDAGQVAGRLIAAGLLARTVTIKVRLHGFVTHTRSRTLVGATDDPALIAQLGRSLLAEVDTGPGVRLLGVGVAGLTDVLQQDLFSVDTPVRAGPPTVDQDHSDVSDTAASSDDPRILDGESAASGVDAEAAGLHRARRRMDWPPGADVQHDAYGRGWVWGAGLGRVTVRFETAETRPGPVRTFSTGDPALHRL